MLQRKADSLHHEDFNLRSPSEGSVVIKSRPSTTVPKPNLQNIIHIAFPHNNSGRAYAHRMGLTAAIMDNLPCGKTINFKFFSASQSL